MKNYKFKKIILLSILLSSCQMAWAACDQTLSPGANLASAISSAAAGSTICLNSGSYAYATLTNISKSSDVIVQSVSGRSASVSFTIRGSNHLKFQNLTISKMDMVNGDILNTNISVLNNTFTGQMLASGSGTNTSINVNILVDGNTFDNINICSGCYTGRLQLWAITGVTISNNHFSGGIADAIQWGGYGGTVGPGNVFEGMLQSAAGSTGAHIDSIQLNGGPSASIGGRVQHAAIIGNYFNNNSIHIGAYDGAYDITVANNVFGSTVDNSQPIQLGAIDGLKFLNNTLVGNWHVSQGAKYGSLTLNKNATYQNNIFVDSYILDTGDQPGCASGCIYDHNLFSSSGNARGTNNIIGKPTFVGGSYPATWAGYQLTPSSLGYGANLGANYFGVGTTPPSSGGGTATLAPPSNLRHL